MRFQEQVLYTHTHTHTHTQTHRCQFLLQGNRSKWLGGNPLTFQLWKHRRTNVKFRIRHSAVTLTDLRNRFSEKDLFYAFFASYGPIKTLGFWGCTAADICNMELQESTPVNLYPYSMLPICTLMVLSNLADPQWSTINCSKSLLPNAVCMNKEQTRFKEKYFNFSALFSSKNCPLAFLLRNGSCYHFIQLRKEEIFVCPKSGKQHSTLYNTTHPQLFEFIFKAVKTIFPSLLRITKGSQVVAKHTYTRHFSDFQWHSSTQSVSRGEGLYICHVPYRFKNAQTVNGNVFRCGQDEYISVYYICDGKNDCWASEDEHSIVCGNSKEAEVLLSCPPLFYKTLNNNCQMVTQPHLGKQNYIAVPDSSISFSHKGCSVLTSVVYDDVTITCKHLTELPCTGSSNCFNISDICMFRLDSCDQLMPCSNGGHLEDCTHFECNAKFKCPGSFCLPWKFICNGKWDCPGGFDETRNDWCGEHPVCKELFRCRESHICIFPQDVCDVWSDCPLQDDEMFCELKSVNCPQSCSCLLYAMLCSSDQNLNIISQPLPFVFYRLSQINTSLITEILPAITNAIFLNLSFNNVEIICNHTHKLFNLVSLDLQSNKIKDLSQSCFYNLKVWKSAHLQNNNISELSKWSFNNLQKLQALNLSSNKINFIPSNVFRQLFDLAFVFLEQNLLFTFGEHVFDGLSLKFVKTNNYRLCCVLTYENSCHATKLLFESCQRMIPSKSLQIVTAVSLFLIVLFNFCCLLLHSFKKEASTYETIICLINGSNTLLFVYLLILWVVDLAQNDLFFMFDSHWRSGYLCFTAFGISVVFHIVASSCLLLLAFARMTIVVSPFDTTFKRKEVVCKIFVILLFASLLVALPCGILVKVLYKALPNNFCSPMTERQESFTVTKLVSALLFLFQLIVAISIIVCHTVLYKNLDPSSAPVGRKSRKTRSLLIQLCIVAGSNFLYTLSWICAFLLFMYAIFSKTGPLWVTVTIIPANCITNPIVFIVTEVRQRWLAQG